MMVKQERLVYVSRRNCIKGITGSWFVSTKAQVEMNTNAKQLILFSDSCVGKIEISILSASCFI